MLLIVIRGCGEGIVPQWRGLGWQIFLVHMYVCCFVKFQFSVVGATPCHGLIFIFHQVSQFVVGLLERFFPCNEGGVINELKA